MVLKLLSLNSYERKLNMVCESCAEVVRNVLDAWKHWQKGQGESKQDREYPVTREQLQKAAKEHCIVCSKFVDNNVAKLKRIFPDKAMQERGFKIVEIIFEHDTVPHIEVSIEHVSRIRPHLCTDTILFDVVPLRQRPHEQISWVHSKTVSTGDPKTLELALRWFQQCKKDHKLCRHSRQGQGPSRLIDLAPAFENGNCRLIENSPKLRGGYATLSHRWGKETPRLTAINFETFVSGVPWRRMPGVFRDASKVARVLGIRYLWVDSICMFQDNMGDLVEGLQRMQEIYSDAVVNLSALTAKANGLFATRDFSKISHQNTVLQPLKNGVDSPTMLLDYSFWENNVQKSALGMRGWVLQEQLLARRTLYFGHDQILWECWEGRRCETYPHCNPIETMATSLENSPRSSFLEASYALGSFSDNVLETIRQAISPSIRDNTLTTPDVNSASLMIAWMNFVNLYSERSLTFPSDKLPAISGIAKRFAQVTEYQWYAGLWLEQMPLSLLWSANSNYPGLKQDDYPTWSWASQLYSVSYLNGRALLRGLTLSKVLDVECKPIDDNAFGRVSHGVLRLLAPTVKLVTNNTTGITSLWSEQDAVLGPSCEVLADSYDYSLKWDDGFECSGPEKSSDPEQIQSLDQQLVAVLIAAYDIYGNYETEGLVLEKVSEMMYNPQKPIYRRVGHFSFSLPPHAGQPPGLPPDVFIWPGDTRKTIDFDKADFLTEFTII